MKAEERKELETNALADRMGHMMQRMRTQPHRSTLYWVIGGVILLAVLAFGVRWFQVSREEESARWRLLDMDTRQAVVMLKEREGETNPGKAARFQYAWIVYWEGGVKRLGLDGPGALSSLDEAGRVYVKLAEDCAGDPFWEPEALYGLAVVEETHAVQDLKRLDSAKKLYEDLAAKHGKSARGKLAKKWLEDYETPKGEHELKQFYQEIGASLNIPNPEIQRLLQKHMRDQQEKAKAKAK